MARKPLDSEKIQAPSLPEINDAFESFRKNYGRKPGNKAVTRGHFLNAIVLHFLTLPEAEQEWATTAGAARYQELLDLPDLERGEPKILESKPVVDGGSRPPKKPKGG